MKAKLLLSLLVAGTLPLATIIGEDSTKTQVPDQQGDQTTDTSGMKAMMSTWKDQDAELDKLINEMNTAAPDKKVDAVAAVLTKLVEQRKAMRDWMQKMVSSKAKDATGMCRMMMMGMDMSGEDSGSHSHHN
jgi:ABC-type glycerol-3-phosphate transport system substrate-binding protein